MSSVDLVVDAVARHLDAAAGASRWLLAFSGGPDSTALALAFSRLAARRRLVVTLAHFDHGLDPGSAERAEKARRLAERLGLPVVVERAAEEHARGTSLEDWARRRRYAFLHALADRLDCDFLATGHHADDQAETVLLRLAFGSGLRGLAAMRPRRGRLVRPLLELRRPQLEEAVREAGLVAVEDRTNLDLERPRNYIRHVLVPELEEADSGVTAGLCRLARGAERATTRLDARLTERLGIGAHQAGAALDRRALEALPEPLWTHALSILEHAAGRRLPTAASARSELRRQLLDGDRVGCDAGGGWRWQGDTRQLRLLSPQKPMPRFTYTLQVPGSVLVTETDTLLSITGAPSGPPAGAERADRTLLRPPSGSPRRVEVRNRRPGDRVRPAGRRSDRRLKEVLIDRRIPRDERDRLPLLVIDGRIAWVPGVTLDDRFRARTGEPAWLVELRPTTESTPRAL